MYKQMKINNSDDKLTSFYLNYSYQYLIFKQQWFFKIHMILIFQVFYILWFVNNKFN